MRVRVILERERGEYRPSFGAREAGTGDLHLGSEKVGAAWVVQEWVCEVL